MDKSSGIEPLAHHGLSDYHCHCDYSFDAVGTIDEYCSAALARGLAEICFTTHFDTSPFGPGDDNVIRIKGELKPATPDNLQPYLDDIAAAHDKYYGLGLSVKTGLEYSWFPGCEEAAGKLKDRFSFDHFLCGIHELDGLCFCCSKCYEECLARFTVEEAVDKYVGHVVEAAESRLFDCIAHLDYIRKFGEGYYGPSLNDLLFERGAAPMFEALRASGTALEVNTSAIRRNFNDNFPRVRLVNAARKAGVSVRFLGSDAHAPDQVGFDFDAAASLVASEGAMWCED